MLERDDDDRELEIDLETGDEQEIEDEEDEGAEKEDRGDDAEPEVNERNLRKLASEAEGKEEEEEDDSEGEAEAGGPSMIPKGRLNKALKARDEEREARIRAEERARLLEEQIRGQGGKKEDETPAVDLKALRKQRMEAMMEGDIEKATELEEQIETEIRRAAREDAVAEVTAATARQQFAEAVADVIEAYPFFDSKSKEANSDAIEQVVALRNQYINKGDSPAAALRRAAEKVGPLYESKSKKATKGRDEEEDDEQEEEGRPSKKRVSLRERLALKRNADAARRQPAALKGGVGERATATKINVAEMDEDEYDKLPEKMKRQLRGDDV